MSLTIHNQLNRLAERLPKTSAGYADFRRRASIYRHDPVAYAYDILGVKVLDEKLIEAAESLLKPPYRTLLRSANNYGKTFTEGWLANWFYDNHDPGICRATAPTLRQVRDLLFKELRRQRKYKQDFAPIASRLQSSIDHYVEGFTARDADSFQGTHELNLMLLFDEATGIKNDFWERGEGMFGGHEGHYWLCGYNPNDPSSPAYLAEESNIWNVIVLNALEHINITEELKGNPPPIPSAIRLNRVQDRIKSECDEVKETDINPVLDFEFPVGSGLWYRPKTVKFEASVLGRWPLLPTDSLFTPLQVDISRELHLYLQEDWPLQIGVDVARFGDDLSGLAVRRGPCLLNIEVHSRRDTKFLAERVENLLYTYSNTDEEFRSSPVVIDGTGGYGAGITDQLAGFNVLELSMSSQSPDPRFLRLRTYVWFKLMEYSIANLFDLSRLEPTMYQRLKEDLIAPRYTIDTQGRKVLEPKAQIKQRLGRSPDVGDAVTLAYYTE